MTIDLSALLPAPVGTFTTELVVAQQPGNGDNGGQGEDFGKSSPVGLLILILFLVAVAFLVRSMSKHLKRVPASFDEQSTEAASERDGGPVVEHDGGPAEKPDSPTGSATSEQSKANQAGATS